LILGECPGYLDELKKKFEGGVYIARAHIKKIYNALNITLLL